jgi:hypothetical protein
LYANKYQKALKLMFDRLEAETAAREKAEETNKRLHRRTQEAESACVEWKKFSELTKGQATGRFYPALMRYALTKAHEENEQLQASIKLLQRAEIERKAGL